MLIFQGVGLMTIPRSFFVKIKIFKHHHLYLDLFFKGGSKKKTYSPNGGLMIMVIYHGAKLKKNLKQIKV